MREHGTLVCLLIAASAWWWITGDATAQSDSRASAGNRPTHSIEVDDCVIRFGEEVDVPAVEAGVLADVMVRQNQLVEAEQTLARQSDERLLIQKRIALLQKKAADEKLADDLELQYAQTAFAEATAELDASRSIYDNAAGAVPLSTLRKLRLAVKRAELEVERERKQRRLAQVEIDLRLADLQMLEQQASRLIIRSPLPGVVLEVHRQTGEWINMGEAVARVARLDRLHAHCLLSVERLPPRWCAGQAVTVRWQEAGVERSLRGVVTSVDPELLAGGRYRLHAEIQNVLDGEQWRLLPGTDVTMTVHPDRQAASRTSLLPTGPGVR